METQRIPVAKRTRGQINKRIDELIAEHIKKKKQQKQTEIVQETADSENSKRAQESRKRENQVCNEEGDKRSNLVLEEERNEESRDNAPFEVSSSSSEDDSDDTLYMEDESTDSSDDDQEVSEKADKKRRETKSKHGLEDECEGESDGNDIGGDSNVCLNDGSFVKGRSERLGQCLIPKSRKKMNNFGSITDPVLVSESDDSSEESSSSRNCDDKPCSPSKRGRKKRKLPEISNPPSVSTHKKQESEIANETQPVFELVDSGSSSSESSSSSSDEDDSSYCSQKQRSPSNCESKKQKLPEISNPKQKKPEFEKANGTHRAYEVDDSDRDVTRKRVESKRQCGRPHKNKAKVTKGFDFIKTLNDSIWQNGGDPVLPREETSPVENSLQLKFRFEYEDAIIVEKDEEEKEIDKLFADLEMGLTETEIGSTNVRMEEAEDDIDVTMMTPAERCRLGRHCVILIDSIGMVCKYCRAVCMEIHHILPKMINRTKERGRWYESTKKKDSIFDKLKFDESTAYENHYTRTNRTGSVLNLIPDNLKDSMYLHQRDGYKFLWKNMVGETLIEKLKTPLENGGTGCVISHAPGTGKSFLTIVFLHSFLNVYPDCRPMIVAPQSMLLTWEAELNHWGVKIPFHNLNDDELSGQENLMATKFFGGVRNFSSKEREAVRMIKLFSWTKDRGILGVGYQLFEILSANHTFRKILLEKPGIVVFDEGHTARNKRSRMWKILMQIETRRRISLSGTPFQNNFDELHNSLSLVKPGFDQELVLENHSEISVGRGRKGKGRSNAWDSLTKSIDKNSPVVAVEMLKSMFSSIVHVHKGSILQQHLPGLKDTLIILKPTNEQKKLLDSLPNNMDNFKRYCVESHISVHPSVAANHDLFQDSKARLERLEHVHDAGVKTKVLIEIIRLCIARNEKVLVFTFYLEPLRFIMNLLTSYFSWSEGKQVFIMEGKVEPKDRQSMINRFNDAHDDAKVLLASINACSEGINLVGGSRVVLLDVVWNPSKERQAICRAYRLGQKNVVHVYRLVMSGISELEKYRTQTKKDRLSEMVFSSKEGDIHKAQAGPSCVSDDMVLDAIVQHVNLRDSFEHIFHQPRETNLFDE